MATSEMTYSEPDYVRNKDKTETPFWRPTIADNTPPETHELLQSYSKIPREEHTDHIHRARDALWAIRQYPCTGAGGFLKPQLCLSPDYSEILARVKKGDTLVDIGTFIGHDLRRLVYDGADSANLWGVDIANHFDVGFEFFNDRDRWKGRFVEADFLSIDTNEALQPLRNAVDVVVVNSVLHQWDLAGQLRGAIKLTEFTKPGSLVVGLQMGTPNPRVLNDKNFAVPLYAHDPTTFGRLWDEVGAATGTRWETKAQLRSWEWIGADSADWKWAGDDIALMSFTVRRLA